MSSFKQWHHLVWKNSNNFKNIVGMTNEWHIFWVLPWTTVSCLGTWVIRKSGKTIYRIQYLDSSANPKPLFFLLILHLFLFLLHAHFCLCFDQEQTLVQKDDKGDGEEACSQVYRNQSDHNCILPSQARTNFSVSHIKPAWVAYLEKFYY